MYERIPPVVTRVLEAALKWTGLAALAASCALMVYLGAVVFARMSAWMLFP